jgi:guanosine-3',5'-bis(diphosphate) 3'-pyrophosphohydrolase
MRCYAKPIIQALYHMKRTKKNHALLIEYFLHEFTVAPEDIISLIREVKKELQDTDNCMREKLARRYLDIFSFLCERFGLYEDKLELDDLCFSINNPKEYKKLEKALAKYQKKSQKIIDEVLKIFSQKFEKHKVQVIFKGRYKNILSIYKKAQKSKLKDILKLNDIFAFRLITQDETEDCFEVLNILHDSFIPLPSRYKDYISIPKINGYQSLHTGLVWVIDDFDLTIEVQIRTKTMDEIAESGIAAHFLYAKNKSSEILNGKEHKLHYHFRQVAESVPINPYIYCFSPSWDVFRLRRGNSVTDFAHKIHSKLAQKALYANINNNKYNMSHILKNFDTIEIITP